MLRIGLAKKADGSGVLRCCREDGSVTWHKQTARHAAHFTLHDLTHWAVETVLGYKHGFFGLIADGWEMDDTTGKGTRGALPSEAIEVERVVGLFDTERGSGTVWTVDEFNTFAPRPLSEEQIRNIKARRAELFREWFALAPGGSPELTF